MPTTTYTVKVVLNGTDENPWHRMNLTMNPFPGQIAKAEYDAFEMLINSLNGDPITSVENLKERLLPYLPEDNDFVQECLRNYMPGERITFMFSFEGVD